MTPILPHAAGARGDSRAAVLMATIEAEPAPLSIDLGRTAALGNDVSRLKAALLAWLGGQRSANIGDRLHR